MVIQFLSCTSSHSHLLFVLLGLFPSPSALWRMGHQLVHLTSNPSSNLSPVTETQVLKRRAAAAKINFQGEARTRSRLHQSFRHILPQQADNCCCQPPPGATRHMLQYPCIHNHPSVAIAAFSITLPWRLQASHDLHHGLHHRSPQPTHQDRRMIVRRV